MNEAVVAPEISVLFASIQSRLVKRIYETNSSERIEFCHSIAEQAKYLAGILRKHSDGHLNVPEEMAWLWGLVASDPHHSQAQRRDLCGQIAEDMLVTSWGLRRAKDKREKFAFRKAPAVFDALTC